MKDPEDLCGDRWTSELFLGLVVEGTAKTAHFNKVFLFHQEEIVAFLAGKGLPGNTLFFSQALCCYSAHNNSLALFGAHIQSLISICTRKCGVGLLHVYLRGALFVKKCVHLPRSVVVAEYEYF